MASWIIVLTFVATLVYLINSNRDFAPLALVASAATAMILCLFGLLFTAASNALLGQFGNPISAELPQAIMVSVGVMLGVLIRHYWKRSM